MNDQVFGVHCSNGLCEFDSHTTTKYINMNEVKLIQDTMISTLNFSQQEIDNVSNYSEELIKEIIKEIKLCMKQ